MNSSRCPAGSRMRCDIEMHDPASVMQQDDKAVQGAKGRCWHSKEINCGDLPNVILQKTLPRLRWWLATLDAILRHGGCCNIKAEQMQFCLNARCSPEWILARESSDQLAYFFADLWMHNTAPF